MTRMGGYGLPGMGSLEQTTERQIIWGGAAAQGLILTQSAVYSGTIRDDASTPTTIIPPGLIVGKISASGELEEWDADVATGTQDIVGVVLEEFRAQDFDANNADRVLRVLRRGPVIAANLRIQGAAFVGHVDEYLARRQMVAAGFVFDDDPMGYLAGTNMRMQTITAEDHTITAAENGTIFMYTHTAAAASAITLPAIKPGLEYDLVRAANSAEDFVIASAEGDNIIVGNDLSADSVTWTTTGQMIGARMRVKAVYLATTLKWLCELPEPPFGTGLTGSVNVYSINT